MVAERLEDSLIGFLATGGRVLLLSRGALPERPSCHYRTVPFNCGRTGNMGTVVRPHPALGDFPHEGWCDLCFVPMIEGALPMDLAAFCPPRIDPIIRSLGHQLTMDDKAYLFEVRVGRGRLLACSLNIAAAYPSCAAARHLLTQLLRYLAAPPKAPAPTLAPRQLRRLRQIPPPCP